MPSLNPLPNWQERQQSGPLPSELIDAWLFDKRSLTRRLTELSEDGFSVTPLSEGWQPLRNDECSALGAPADSIGWVREVYLRGNGQPWVFARSVATRAALLGSGMNLQQLGSRSLGELLFSDQAFTRGPLQICHYPPAWLPSEASAEHLWARRSRFQREALGVLVAEVFLPDFWTAAAHTEPL